MTANINPEIALLAGVAAIVREWAMSDSALYSCMRCDPKVTILMPVYNGERFLDDAIASVLEQDFRDFEFVIVDDASTDLTPQILRRWAERDARIVILTVPENGGVASALNRGLAVARGKYIARQDADDLCVFGRLARQVDVLNGHADVVLVSACYDLIDAHGAWVGRERRTNPPEVTAYLLNFSNAVIGHGQVMFRRDDVIEVGGYRAEFEAAEDYDLWSRLSRRGRILMLPIVGMKYRLHDRQASVVSFEIQRRHAAAVSRRMITELLGRAITPEEEHSVMSVWRHSGHGDVAVRAHAVLKEAYGHFAKATTSSARRRRVRLATARRWVLSAVPLARNGEVVRAAQHLAYGLRWHPLGIAAAIELLARRIIISFRRVL